MIQIKDILTLDRTIYMATAPSKKKSLELIADTISLSVPQLRTHDIFDALVAREQLGTTALGEGVAIPHCSIETIENPLGCFILLKEGVDFDAKDHVRVNMLFSLILPINMTKAYLDLLEYLPQIFVSEKIKQFSQATSREDLFQRIIHSQTQTRQS